MANGRPGARPGLRDAERGARICWLYHEASHTLQEIADEYGLSRQRVHQILLSAGEPSSRKYGRGRLKMTPAAALRAASGALPAPLRHNPFMPSPRLKEICG